MTTEPWVVLLILNVALLIAGNEIGGNAERQQFLDDLGFGERRLHLESGMIGSDGNAFGHAKTPDGLGYRL